MKINILVLAAGHIGKERSDGGYPDCLAEFDGKALIERLIENTQNIQNVCYTFAMRKEEVEQYHLDRVVELIAPGSRVVRVSNDTRGSACTTLLAASQFVPQEEVLVISANELVDTDFNEVIKEFREKSLDGGVLTFRSFHPRYSYVRLDNDGLVIEVAQKKPISLHATTGAFWFSRAGDLVTAIKDMIRKDARVDGGFYVAPAFNEILLKQGRVGVRAIDPKKYHPLKTERQVDQFEQAIGI